MTLADIQRVQNDFLAAAMRAAKAGVKVIEVHAAHGYLLNQFLSPYSNHRTDLYGGSVKNRTRMVREVVEQIRAHVPEEIAISVRVSGNEFVKGGLIPEDFRDIVPALENAGMDLLNISVGVGETVDHIIPDASFGEAPFVSIAEVISQFATVPVCIVGSISSLKTAETIVFAKKADFVAIGRSQIADHQFVNKSMLGNEGRIQKCLRCNKCLYWNTGDSEMHCVVNHL